MLRLSIACARALTVILMGLIFSGCVTAKKYRMTNVDSRHQQSLGWSSSAAPVTLTLQSLIVIKGPGSWKRVARWDEYVVRLDNAGSQPFIADSVDLVDVLGKPQHPGVDPWQLERQSATNWDTYGKNGLKLLAGAGVVVLYGAAVSAAATVSFMSAGAAGGGMAVLDAIPLIAVVDIAAVAVMNHSNKKEVEAEFERRRLKLPVTIAAGGSVSGSWFFPMTPAPPRLIVHGRAGDAPFDVTLELPQLSSLHLAPKHK